MNPFTVLRHGATERAVLVTFGHKLNPASTGAAVRDRLYPVRA